MRGDVTTPPAPVHARPRVEASDLGAWPDADLVLRARDGDERAFRALFVRHAGEVLRLVERMLGERGAAEDALQETFLRLHRALGGIDADRPLRPYLLAIARNAAIEQLRRRKLDVGSLAAEPSVEGDGAAEAALGRERRDALDAALAALAPDHRAVVLLRHAHGLTLEAIAAALGCTSRTVHNRLRAAAILLARELRRRGVGPLGEPGRESEGA